MSEVIDAPTAAPDAAAPSPAAPAAPAAAPAPAAAAPAPAGEPTVLDVEETWDWSKVDEKFQVKDDKGELDKDATAAKLAKSYAEIQKRASRGGDVRPKTVADYALNVPDDLKEAVSATDPSTQAALSAMHAAGFTQKQLDVALSLWSESAKRMVGGAAELDRTTAATELRGVWKTEAEFVENVGAARRAMEHFGGPELTRKYGNDPLIIQMAAKVGAGMREDSPPSQVATSGSFDVQAAMRSEAYSNADHADHLAMTRRVNQWHAAQPGANTPL